MIAGAFPAIGHGGSRQPADQPRAARECGPRRISECLVVGLAVVKAIANMSYRKLVSGLEAAHLDPLAVDPDPIGASQIANDDFPVLVHHAAMMPGDAERIEPRIACRVTPHDH